jgi:molybdenum cofactor biosynthesis enzyme
MTKASLYGGQNDVSGISPILIPDCHSIRLSQSLSELTEILSELFKKIVYFFKKIRSQFQIKKTMDLVETCHPVHFPTDRIQKRV